MEGKMILASASPRRKELLQLITDRFIIEPSKAEEIVPTGTTAMQTAEHLALLKAKDVAMNYSGATVIGADTCVIADNQVLGKPKDRDDAKRMLEILSGNTHKVVTGCALIKGDKQISFSVVTEVTFYCLSKEEIEEYIATDEPYDKAGGYAIQGKASLFVKEIKGDYFNVVGLPIAELNRQLREL